MAKLTKTIVLALICLEMAVTTVTARVHGQATFYYQNGNDGSCGGLSSDNEMIGALNWEQYDQMGGAAACKKCVRVYGPLGSVKIKIADRCAGCNWGNIDLTPAAFKKISPESTGRVQITWGWTSC